MMWVIDVLIIIVCVTVVVGLAWELPGYIKRMSNKHDVIEVDSEDKE